MPRKSWLRVLFSMIALAVIPGLAHAQSTLLQAGGMTPGHAPMYVGMGSYQPTVQDSGPAAGGGVGLGLSELYIQQRASSGTSTPPYANAGTGPYGTNFCDTDGPTTSANGYHALCFGPNSQGGALIAYNAYGTATALPLNIEVNGSYYQFPPTTACATCGTIATQNANAVAITGGAISGTSIVTYQGIGTSLHNVTSGTTYTVPATLMIAVVRNDSTALTVTLPAASNYSTCPSDTAGTCPIIYVKDGGGNANTYNITITTPDGKLIDGSSTYVMNIAYQNTMLIFNGTNWSVF